MNRKSSHHTVSVVGILCRASWTGEEWFLHYWRILCWTLYPCFCCSCAPRQQRRGRNSCKSEGIPQWTMLEVFFRLLCWFLIWLNCIGICYWQWSHGSRNPVCCLCWFCSWCGNTYAIWAWSYQQGAAIVWSSNQALWYASSLLTIVFVLQWLFWIVCVTFCLSSAEWLLLCPA